MIFDDHHAELHSAPAAILLLIKYTIANQTCFIPRRKQSRSARQFEINEQKNGEFYEIRKSEVNQIIRRNSIIFK